MKEWEIESVDFEDLSDLVRLANKVVEAGCGALFGCGKCGQN